MGDLGTYLPLVLIAGAFYFLVMRPSQNRKKKMAEQMNAMGPGTEVMTSSGIFGTVVGKTDEYVEVSIAPGVIIKLLPAAISRVVPTPVDAPAHDSDPDSTKE